MGATRVTVKLVNMENKQSYEALFLVDTGATDLLAPGDELEKIGLERVGKETYELADGREISFDYGVVRIEMLGNITAGRVIFGPPAVEPLLGVLVLEAFGIVVDPKTHTLRKLPALLLK